MSLTSVPACLPLLLGGLPHRNAAQALEVSRRYAGQLLAWPQLPQRSFREQSFVQSAIGFPGLVIDATQSRVYVDRARAESEMDRFALAYLQGRSSYAALAPDDAAGLEELSRQRDAARGALALKGQILGPISLAAQLTDEHDQPLIYDDMLFDALVQHLRLRAEWQEAQLLELNDSTIMCIDEPFLETVGLPFLPIDWERAREQINHTLDGVRGYKGIFAGGAVDWAQVLQIAVDLIVADIYNHAAGLAAAAPALATFLEHDGIVGLGIIPAEEEQLEQVQADQLVERIVALAQQLEPAGISTERLLRQSVISTAGTLSRLSIGAAERALQQLAELSKLLREQFNLS
jgi:hypothetical protein